MNKVICDVCGTTYPDTSAQCPICGSARNSVSQTGADSTGEGSSYTYVRGGRFSKSNVRKRNRTGQDYERRPAAAPAKSKAQEASQPARRTQPKQEDDSVTVNKGLIVVVIILLLAIIAVTAYICVKFILPGGGEKPDPGKNPGGTTTTVAPQPTGTTEVRIPCESLTLSGSTIEFTKAGDSWLLSAEKAPADATDEILFASSDEAVATVSQSGLITAVNYGQAVITVTCGDVSAQCTVVCSFGTPPETTQPTEPVDPNFVFEFNTRWVQDDGTYDCTIDAAGKTWRAYKNDLSVDPEDIVWTVDDPTICSVDNGIVTALKLGMTKIHATYQGKTYNCIIRCTWEVPTEPTEPTETTQPTEPSEPSEPTEPSEPSEPTEPSEPGDTTEPSKPEEGGETTVVRISHTDVTLLISSGTEYDRSFNLQLRDSEGNVLEVTWMAETEGIVTIEGNKITGIAVGTTNVYCTYEGATYICIVRVAE